MNKTKKILLYGVLALIAFTMFLEVIREEPIDWTPSYVSSDSRPLGSEIFFENLSEKAKQIINRSRPPFEEFNEGNIENGTYFFLNNYVNLSKEETDQIFDWVSQGNNVFFASAGIPQKILDTLDLNITFHVSNSKITYKPAFNLLNESLRLKTPKVSPEKYEYLYFKKIDTLETIVLGVASVWDDDQIESDSENINFIKIPWGDGQILIHLAPQVFTNYFMIGDENHEYVSRILNYIDLSEPIYWDKYYKLGKKGISSPLYYLLSNIYLKWAYYMILIASLFYIIFSGKRKQKPIKIIPPVSNKTYEFTQTIAGMHLEKKDHKEMANKIIKLFLEKIRHKYQLNTQELNIDFIKNLAHKTGIDFKVLKDVFQYISEIQNRNTISEEELKTLNNKISELNI
ncbi:DUF4350 domain-containing protein [Psychroflexus aestuariivivens]|uniref:DUF4350 domain-containing protein n=1 Tax=Psychroflexus aestuariivivens TaxID=1795040 RepID=UPI000FD9C8FA|nr:DUF4350 domain-containing protein [Psychroflexus aestuariivivens]